MRALSFHIESNERSIALFRRMIFSEKSASFRDHAPAAPTRSLPGPFSETDRRAAVVPRWTVPYTELAADRLKEFWKE